VLRIAPKRQKTLKQTFIKASYQGILLTSENVSPIEDHEILDTEKESLVRNFQILIWN